MANNDYHDDFYNDLGDCPECDYPDGRTYVDAIFELYRGEIKAKSEDDQINRYVAFCRLCLEEYSLSENVIKDIILIIEDNKVVFPLFRTRDVEVQSQDDEYEQHILSLYNMLCREDNALSLVSQGEEVELHSDEVVVLKQCVKRKIDNWFNYYKVDDEGNESVVTLEWDSDSIDHYLDQMELMKQDNIVAMKMSFQRYMGNVVSELLRYYEIRKVVVGLTSKERKKRFCGEMLNAGGYLEDYRDRVGYSWDEFADAQKSDTIGNWLNAFRTYRKKHNR